MGRQKRFEIKETLVELKSYKCKVSNYKSCQRLRALILLKEDSLISLTTVAEQLAISTRSLSRWILLYKKKGIEAYLAPETRDKPSKIITQEIHESMENRLKITNNPFNSYMEVQQWLKKEHNIEIEYQWLWKYLKSKMGTTLKVPRKSHSKKDPEAAEVFFKNAFPTKTH